MSTATTAYTLYTSGEYVILANTEPYLEVKKLTGVEECFQDNGIGTILKKEFRYSVDCETFSEFQEINTQNLEDLGDFDKVWFQFRYILLSGGPITIIKVNATYIPREVDKFDGYVAPNIKDESRVYAFPVTYKSNFLWEPYKMNRAIRLYKDLNLMVNNLFGHDTVYYRALPEGRSKDVFLMEFSLYEHDEGQCVKVVVPDNAFPDNKLSMGPFGVDFEMPFEIQVDKDYYQKIFGEGSGPQKRDVIYFPRTNRIYEVSSSYLFRDFMNEPLYFKVTLIKWAPKANAEQSSTLDTLESFTVSAASLFKDEIKNEEVKVTNPEQFNVAHTGDNDPVRSLLLRDQETKEERIVNYHNIISEFNYNMASLVSTSRLKVKLDSSLLLKDTTYFARFSPESSQPSETFYYSIKKLKYRGNDDEGKSIFEYSGGNSEAQNLYSAAQIFSVGSPFSLYNSEYDGSTASPVVSCSTQPAEYCVDKIVKYKGTTEFKSNEDRSYSAWFRLKDSSFSKHVISSFGFDEYSRELDLNLAIPCLYFMGDDVEITRTSSSEFLLFGKVVEVVSQTQIKVEVPLYVYDFVKSSYSSWTSYADLQVQKCLPKVFLNSLKDSKGIKIELFGKRHFRVTSNTEEIYVSVPNGTSGLSNGSWFALYINMSNMFKQMTLNVWRTQWDPATNLPATTDLTLVINKTLPMKREDRTSPIEYYLTPSPMDLTNIRLFSKVTETDKQPLILNQNIVKDAQWAIIIDNALPQSKLPLIGYTR